MSVFDKIRQKSAFIAFIVKLANTWIFPAAVAVICVISATHTKEVYLPCIYIITLMSVFVGLFSDDMKVFLVPALMAFFALGADIPDDFYSTYVYMPKFDLSSVPHFAICFFLLAAALIYKLISIGAAKEMCQKRGLFFWGIIFIDIALMLNGAFSPTWRVENLLYGAMTAVPLTLFYCLFLTVIARSENGVSYACKTLVAAGFSICAQVIITAIRLNSYDNLFITMSSGAVRINRTMLSMAWGPPTVVGAAIAIAIPAALYLTRSCKYPCLSYIFALIFWVMTVFIDTRSAIVFGGIILIFGIIFCCISGKNRKQIRIMTLILVLLVAIVSVWMFFVIPERGKIIFDNLIEALRLDFDTGLEEEDIYHIFGGRIEHWKRGVHDFLRAPLFGSGFMSGCNTTSDVYFCMYHNVIIEFLGSMGLFGIFAFLLHLKHGLEAIIRRFSLDKFLLLCVPMCILGMSLLDNFFFYPNFAIVYAVFLACAEVSLEHKRLARLNNLNRPKPGEKPRVVFTYIEAGKGHIVPTRTVCNAFREKYGDKVELIESKFFTETGNPDMEQTEKLFTRAVKKQNRSPVLSVLCKIGNLLAGDNFALQLLLSNTVSGRKTAPLAIKHMEEFDAHLVYTAHWATPYYINKMHTPRPYTICFCPDVYSNGVFDVDCNNFLISSDVGERKISHIRMYAGGNITRIPFPSRPEIAELKQPHKKLELRRELGLDPDGFVVTLSDGGYGMARLGSTIENILKYADTPITAVAFCGTNDALYDHLKQVSRTHTNKNVTLIPFGFSDQIIKYIAASDLYVGKSGANSISEPASLGVPIIVNKCSTYIETGIKNYYVRNLKGAVHIPNAKLAAKKVIFFAHNRAELEKLHNNLISAPDDLYNAEASADLIWRRLCELGYVDPGIS